MDKIKKEFHKSIKENMIITRKIEKKIRKLFCLLMINLVQGYEKFVSIIDEVPYFENEQFAKFKGSDEEFFSEFSQTQIFMLFLQNENDEYISYFTNLKNKISKENLTNVFSKEYFENQNLLNISKSRRRSNSNDYTKVLKSLNSMYINPENNEQKFDTNFSNENNSFNEKINNKTSSNFSSIKIINDYENIFEARERFYLYPYFFDMDSKFKIDEKMKNNILINPDSLQKCVYSLYDNDEEMENILPINERIFEDLKILDFLEIKISENLFRYNFLEDEYFNNVNKFNPFGRNNNNKMSYNFKNIIMDIIKKKEGDNILNNNISDGEKMKLKRQLTRRVTLNL